MIPKIIHYCWFGRGEMPELVQRCMASWHRYMPDWEYRCWNEDNFDIASSPSYVQEAYAARKFAFVSDYVRLWALEREGGVYVDTDVEVLRSYEPLLGDRAFIGFEESRVKPLGTNVIGSEAHLPWLQEVLDYYHRTHFMLSDGSLDMTANSEILARLFVNKGLIRDGHEQMIDGVHIYDFHYFSPLTSTRVMRKNANTYSIHHCDASWQSNNTKSCLCNNVIVREIINLLIQIKRVLFK